MNRERPLLPRSVRRASVAFTVATALALGAAAPAAAVPVLCGDGARFAAGCAEGPPRIDPAPPAAPAGCRAGDPPAFDPCHPPV